MVLCFDAVVVGAGIVGLASALRLKARHPDLRLLILEKESGPAQHQTGRNSGVIHSGIYYRPGSAKAKNCRKGRQALLDFCQEHRLHHELCGKVIVATDEAEANRLNGLLERGRENGVQCDRISMEDLKKREPHVRAVDALYVADTGIVDYGTVAAKMLQLLLDQGVQIHRNTAFVSGRQKNGAVRVRTSDATIETRVLVNCAGLHSDRVAEACGSSIQHRIVPFRGEYFELLPRARSLCRHLIYPVPDPAFPFLGVHFTRMVNGSVECGPNAVFAFAREGYTWAQLRLPDLWDTVRFPGFWRLARRHGTMGLSELWRSAVRSAFVRALQRLIPEIRSSHLVRAPAGVRAQALGPDGALVDDFLFGGQGPLVHVLNAPSPAATSALAIGDQVALRAEQALA